MSQNLFSILRRKAEELLQYFKTGRWPLLFREVLLQLTVEKTRLDFAPAEALCHSVYA